MKGGTGNVTMFGGSNADTMTAGTHDNLFVFDSSQGGGHHNIFGFKDSTAMGGKTQLQFSGYGSVQDILDHARVANGNTFITLDDGTTITLKGFTHLDASEIKH
ncbi:MAG: hypothetical protein IPK78_20950 [Rhodospirillales bacterium]|nr:hypothetical protein [Rhodospirillales bacterium]